MQYTLVINGKPEGPFSVDQLVEMNIRPEDFLKTAEMDDYKEAHEIAELREVLHFKKRIVMPQYFAGFDQRLLASALDFFMVSGLFIVLAFMVFIFVPDKEKGLPIVFSLLALIPVANLVYHIVMESSPKQATYGKQILKIRVCDMEGGDITAGRAIVRNVCKLFSLITVVGYMVSFFSKQQQCLHDMIAGTLVRKDRLI